MNKLHPSLWFILKLIVLYVFFYGLSLALIGITSPEGNLYLPFFAEKLNLVESYRIFLLKASEIFSVLSGFESEVIPPYQLKVGNSGITLVYSCMGYGLMSLWLALIIAYPSMWKQKIFPLLGGIILINLLNILRIGGLAMLYSEGKIDLFNWIDHHTLFNTVVYIFLFIVFIAWIKALDYGKN
jgi:exosortase/archaeosortase family protein